MANMIKRFTEQTFKMKIHSSELFSEAENQTAKLIYIS